MYKCSLGDKSSRQKKLDGFDNALFPLMMVFEFGCCSHEITLNGSFDSVYLTQLLPLAGFVDRYHSSALI